MSAKILVIAGSLRKESNSKAIQNTLCERNWGGAVLESFDLEGIGQPHPGLFCKSWPRASALSQ